MANECPVEAEAAKHLLLQYIYKIIIMSNMNKRHKAQVWILLISMFTTRVIVLNP